MMKISNIRTSLGFGVHSPFAYDFIRNVLRERYSYYSYADLRKILKSMSQGDDIPFVLMLFRIMIYFRLRNIETSGSVYKWQHKLEDIVDGNIAEPDNDGDTVKLYLQELSEPGKVDTIEFADFDKEFILVSDFRKIRGKDMDLMVEKLKAVNYGESFICTKKYIVTVALRHLPAQQYILNF